MDSICPAGILMFMTCTVCALGTVRNASSNSPHECAGINYGSLGCFSRDYPFNNTPELPQDPEFIGTTFYLYTRDNPNQPHMLRSLGVQASIAEEFDHFYPGQPSKVLIHGFLCNSQSPWLLELTQRLLQQENLNILIVDWGAGAGFPYTQAAANTRVVGAQLAQFINLLIQHRGASARHFHLIGHSLGAHVAGFAGQLLNRSLSRITGLDPADPNFSYEDPIVRLDPTDARWVDCIHTDASAYYTYGGYGTMEPMGHIDFYPNGGREQPGCPAANTIYSFAQDTYFHGMTNAEYAMTCNHDRATLLFLESVSTPCPFTAYPCSNNEDFNSGKCFRCGNRGCPSLGYRADFYKTTGTFYLKTASQSPFCGYHYLVEMTFSNDTQLSGKVFQVQIGGDQGITSPFRLQISSVGSSLWRQMLLSPINVGQLIWLQVQVISVRFTWRSTPVKIQSAKVQGKSTVYFCPGTDAAYINHSLTLEGGTDTPGICHGH